MAEGVTAINQAIDAADQDLLLAGLQYPRASVYGVTSQCTNQYLVELQKVKAGKAEAGRCPTPRKKTHRAFNATAPSLWNKLPRAITEEDNFKHFKSKLKTFLCRKAFE